MNPEQLKAALRSAGYLVMSEGGGGYGTEPGDPWVDAPVTYYYFGPRGRASVAEVAAATGVPELALENAKPSMEATPEESASLYPSRGGGGFFSHLMGLVTSPSFALAASVVAPSILAAEAAGAAALASGAEGLAVPAAAPPTAAPAAAAAPAATAFPVATSPLAAPSVLASDTLGASLSGLTAEQIAAATSANALAPTAAATGAGVANALSPETLAALDAGLGGVPAGAGAGAAGAGAAGAGTNALVGYGGAGDVLNPVTGAVIPGAGAAALTGAGLAGAAGAGALGASALVPLALAGTGVLGAITARNAAETQADAARYASDQAYKIYQEQKALAEPFRTAGIGAQNQLLTLLGLPGGTQGAEFGRYARPFGMQDFQADPGYAFRLSEGMKALEASRAAQRGGSTGLLSGATGKALQRYGQDLASQEYGSAFNRYQTERANRLAPLGSLTSMGQAAAAGQAGYAGQYGANVGNLATSGAAAQAAGQVGMTNALTGALNTYLNYSANQNMVNALQDAAVRRASMYGPAIPV